MSALWLARRKCLQAWACAAQVGGAARQPCLVCYPAEFTSRILFTALLCWACVSTGVCVTLLLEKNCATPLEVFYAAAVLT